MVVFARIWARFALGFVGCPLSPPCQQKLFARCVDYGDKKNLPRAADYGDFFLELLQYSCYTGGMPRRLREYLDRLSHRNTHREESNPYTVNTTLNNWQPVRWNATQWFPDNNDTPARVHDNDVSGIYRQMLENAYNNMTAREAMEIADANPENMLRMIRVVPNLTYLSDIAEERPMDPPEPQRHSLYVHDMDDGPVYNVYTPSWSNRIINWPWGDKRSGHVEFRRGRIIRVKRYCKI